MRARASARNRYGDEGEGREERVREWQKRNRESEEEGENARDGKRGRESKRETGTWMRELCSDDIPE